MPPNTSMTQVMAHISNPSCSNAECPNLDKLSAIKKSQQKANSAGGSGGSGHANSVWKAELRVRYVPKYLKDLYEKDRTTCHFYFDQVSQYKIRLLDVMMLISCMSMFIYRLSKIIFKQIHRALIRTLQFNCVVWASDITIRTQINRPIKNTILIILKRR